MVPLDKEAAASISSGLVEVSLAECPQIPLRRELRGPCLAEGLDTPSSPSSSQCPVAGSAQEDFEDEDLASTKVHAAIQAASLAGEEFIGEAKSIYVDGLLFDYGWLADQVFLEC